MIKKKKLSFFERLTGGIKLDNGEELEKEEKKNNKVEIREKDLTDEESEEAELSVDVYQTPTEIVVKAMAAGVRPEDLKVNVTRNTITVQGKREGGQTIEEENYFAQELYWGAFSRTIILPEEVEPDRAEAIEKHGLLVVKIPKIDKGKRANLRVKSV